MTEFVRPIQESIEDILILDIETLCDFADHLKHNIPDSLSESELHATLGSILEESADGLVVGEPPGGREQVVLHGRDGGHGNLRGEVAHLVLSESEILLALLKDHFQRPAHRVNSIGLEEIYLAVGSDESVPLAPLVALGEEKAYVASCKDYVNSDVPTAQESAVLASLLRMVEDCDELVGCVLLTFIYVLRLAHLDHTKVMASDVAGSDKQNDLGTGKPTVGQYVVEVDFTLDDATYHLNHQRNLALAVFPNALGGMGILVVFLGEAGIKLLLLQAMVTLLSGLTDYSEVEQHLADAIGNANEQTLEAKHHRVRHMRVYLADKLRLDATLRVVGIIDHQADRVCAVTCPLLLALVPELERDGGENLAPVIRLIGDKPIEHVLPAVKQAA